MKSRILDDGSFGGVYMDEFLIKNKDSFVNNQLVSDLELVESIPSADLIKAKWNNLEWIEGASMDEINYYNKSLIPNTISQRQLRTQLALNGFNLSDVQAVIDSLPDPNKTIAQIAWDYALTFFRDDTLLNSIADILGISESELNDIFINASKL